MLPGLNPIIHPNRKKYLNQILLTCVNSKKEIESVSYTIGVVLMADKENRFPQNVPGKFYVDTQCIDCDLCSTTATENFKRSDEGHAYVAKQPENTEELQLCQDAKTSCPASAIGDDGE